MKKVILLQTLLASLLAATAKAGDAYIGGGLYAADSDIVIAAAEDLDLEDDDTVQALFLGYEFANGIGVELGYYDLGSYSSQIGENSSFVDSDAISASIVASIDIIPMLRVYGKAGYAYVENKIELESELIDIVRDDSNTDVLFGLGAELKFADRISLYAEYIRFDAEVEVDLIGAGVRLNF
ncbi:porin family protein [Puniceicoccaceae bacterium K14]|nr:porin family protein [Puniceicoccaceae bacterium K14]